MVNKIILTVLRTILFKLSTYCLPKNLGMNCQKKSKIYKRISIFLLMNWIKYVIYYVVNYKQSIS